MTKKKAKKKKILEYRDLTTEVQQRMWNLKTKVIPVITGATRTISKSFRQCLSNIPGEQYITELHKISHTVHCTHFAESADVKYIQHGK